MFHLLEIELRKLVPSRDFWLSISAYVFLLPAAFVSLKLFSFEVPNSQMGINLFVFPDVWHNISYVGSWVNYLLYVVVLQVITHEYQHRTMRQNVIDGLSPREYVMGKVSLLALFTLASMLLVAALALLGGWVGSADAAHGIGSFAGGSAVLLYGLQLFGYVALALFLGTLTRKTGAAILAFIGYTLMLEPLLRGLILPTAIGRYAPSYVLGRLVPNPFFGYVGMGGSLTVGTTTILLAAAYAAVLVAAASWLVTRQDL
jgi:hypothetical protein